MPIRELAYAFFNTAGIGGVMVISVIGIATAIYITLTRWILNGSKEKNKDKGHRF